MSVRGWGWGVVEVGLQHYPYSCSCKTRGSAVAPTENGDVIFGQTLRISSGDAQSIPGLLAYKPICLKLFGLLKGSDSRFGA